MTEPPTRTSATEARYRQRYRQLGAAAIAALAPATLTIPLFVDWLIAKRRPRLAAATWRQYRTCVVYGLDRLAAKAPDAALTVQAGITRLKATPPLPGVARPRRRRTSASKAKRSTLRPRCAAHLLTCVACAARWVTTFIRARRPAP